MYPAAVALKSWVIWKYVGRYDMAAIVAKTRIDGKGKAHVLKTHDIALFPFAAEMNQAIVYTRPTKTKRA